MPKAKLPEIPCVSNKTGDTTHEECWPFCRAHEQHSMHACNFCKCRMCTECRLPQLPPPPPPSPSPPPPEDFKNVCNSSSERDTKFSTCSSFCKDTHRDSHCKLCKCHACGFCEGIEVEFQHSEFTVGQDDSPGQAPAAEVEPTWPPPCVSNKSGDTTYEACWPFCHGENSRHVCAFCKCQLCSYCKVPPPPPRPVPPPPPDDGLNCSNTMHSHHVCGTFCKEKHRASHCKSCKCRFCHFCLDVNWTSASGDDEDGVPRAGSRHETFDTFGWIEYMVGSYF